MGKLRHYSLIDVYCSLLRTELARIDEKQGVSVNADKNDIREILDYEFEHFCILGTDWYMFYTPRLFEKGKYLDIDFLSIDSNQNMFAQIIELRRAFEELFLTYKDYIFTFECDESSCALLEWAAKKGYIQITEKSSLFYGAEYEFIPSKSFLKYFKNKTCHVVQRPNLDSLSKESTMCLPKGVHVIRGKKIESKKVQNKKQLIAEDYTKIKGNEEILWEYAPESDIQDSQVCLLGDGWFIDYTLLSSSILIDFWNFSKWGLKQVVEMKKVLEELFYAYRDRLFLAECNKNSVKWIEKLVERGFIEIVKKEDFDYDPNIDYLGFIFKATPAFIDYHESRLKKGRVMLPKKSTKKD